MNKNTNLSNLFKLIKQKKYDFYYIPITNEFLYEYIDDNENLVKYLTDFTGDTANLIVSKNKAYLFIDGRFITQAKKEIKDNRIEVIGVDRSYSIYDFINENIKYNQIFALNPKLISVKMYNRISNILKNKNAKIKFDEYIFNNSNEVNKKKEISIYNKNQISKNVINVTAYLNDYYQIKNDNIIYICTSIEYLACITGIRNKVDNPNDLILPKKFAILYKKKIYIYDNIIEFYEKIKNLRKELKINSKILDVYIDYDKCNYKIYKNLFKNNDINIYGSNDISLLNKNFSILSNDQVSNLRKANIEDGIAMVNSLYQISKIDFDKQKTTEFDISEIVDNNRKLQKHYLSNSFKTIVAYKQNSAICHYIPNNKNSKIIKNDSLLLIDSGGNYTIGTTDITRTLSLYKNIKDIPNIIKKHFTLVLKAMISLSNLIFIKGTCGKELDIIARQYLYTECLDYNHGTGHGIGYINNVHFGPNVFNKSGLDKSNVLEINQIQSCEPGVYFENKYGIRIENDTLTKKYKTDYLCFETLTLCPIDIDLIDKKLLNKNELEWINNYHKLVYDKLKNYLDKNVLNWLKKYTKKI